MSLFGIGLRGGNGSTYLNGTRIKTIKITDFFLIFVCFLTFFLSFSLTGCDKVSNSPANPSQALRFEASASPTPAGEINFIDDINPIFDQNIAGKTCSSAGCHQVNNGTGGNFRVIPDADLIIDDDERMAAYSINYTSASAFTNISSPASSSLLLEPLTGTFPSVGGHGGGDIFILNDLNYSLIIQWISDPVAIDTN